MFLNAHVLADHADVSALAFVSTGVPGEPLSQLFDFQRAAAVAPGQSVVLQFTLPPSAASVVRSDGTRELVPGTTLVGGACPHPAWSKQGVLVRGFGTAAGVLAAWCL